jgi:dTDP-4-dehydrorhamnose reductase
MKIILLGSDGMLGSYLNSVLSLNHSVLALTRKNIDLSLCESSLTSFFEKIVNPGDVIVNSAGIIKQRDFKIEEMIKVNSILPNFLGGLKHEIDCEVIHITTDCVFSGRAGKYDENSKHDCLDEYGKTKSLGENNINTNIRTSIIGEEQRNKRSLLEWVKANKNQKVDGYTNHLWNGVTCLELSKLIEEIIDKKSFWRGVKHVHSPNTVSKYELVSMISDVYELNLKVSQKETSESCFRDLSTVYENCISSNLYQQLLEQKKFSLGT